LKEQSTNKTKKPKEEEENKEDEDPQEAGRKEGAAVVEIFL
jgi:hypothetical protein